MAANRTITVRYGVDPASLCAVVVVCPVLDTPDAQGTRGQQHRTAAADDVKPAQTRNRDLLRFSQHPRPDAAPKHRLTILHRGEKKKSAFRHAFLGWGSVDILGALIHLSLAAPLGWGVRVHLARGHTLSRAREILRVRQIDSSRPFDANRLTDHGAERALGTMGLPDGDRYAQGVPWDDTPQGHSCLPTIRRSTVPESPSRWVV